MNSNHVFTRNTSVEAIKTANFGYLWLHGYRILTTSGCLSLLYVPDLWLTGDHFVAKPSAMS